MVRTGTGVHVAFLRGVNLGGKNRLPMSELVAILEAAGCEDVRTYIQSGNAVFRATAARAARVPAAVDEAVAARFGFHAPVVLRTAAELGAVTRKNPFLAAGADLDHLHVMFLRDRPAAARVAGLDAGRSPGDDLAVLGREIYLHLPNGVGRTKLTNAYFDARLATLGTGRNWRTVLALAGLASGSSPASGTR